MKELYAGALTACINILRENPETLYKDEDQVHRDKLMSSHHIKTLFTIEARPHHQDRQWKWLIDSAYNLIEQDSARLALWDAWTRDRIAVLTLDDEDRHWLTKITTAHARAALYFGSSSAMSVRAVAATTPEKSISKTRVGKYRKMAHELGLIDGTLGRPNTIRVDGKVIKNPDAGEVAHIDIDLPEWHQVPRKLARRWEDHLAPLTPGDVDRIRLALNTARLRKLEAIPTENLTKTGACTLRKVQRAVARDVSSSSSTPSTVLQSRSNEGKTLQCFALLGSPTGVAEEITPTPPENQDARKALVERMRELKYAPWEMNIVLQRRGWAPEPRERLTQAQMREDLQ